MLLITSPGGDSSYGTRTVFLAFRDARSAFGEFLIFYFLKIVIQSVVPGLQEDRFSNLNFMKRAMLYIYTLFPFEFRTLHTYIHIYTYLLQVRYLFQIKVMKM